MYLLKNFRNYIPLFSMLVVFGFLWVYLRPAMNWPFWTEMLVIIIPFGLIPVMNIISMVLNARKFNDRKKLYISAWFSYVLQLLPVLLLMLWTDDKGMGIIWSYLIFLIIVDVITFIYPLKIYREK